MFSTAYCIWIVTPPNYPHSRCFEEVALSLRAAFSALGFDAPVVTGTTPAPGRAVVLGAHLLSAFSIAAPPNAILYNLEQVQGSSAWLNDGYIDLLRRHPVWDYSERNIAAFRDIYGVHGVALCGIGYMPELSRIPRGEEDIDVLFAGSLNTRRQEAIREIASLGLKVKAVFNCYGKERDAMIARAKVILNLHFFEAQVFEIVRVSYLLANRKCVVSETGKDEALENPLRKGIAFAHYRDIASTCAQLIRENRRRDELARTGFECFRECSQVPMLERALTALRKE